MAFFVSRSKAQARFPGRIRERLDPAVIAEPRPIEGNTVNSLRRGTLGDEPAHRRRGILVARSLQRTAHIRAERGDARDDPVAFRRDDLGVDVTGRAMYTQPRGSAPVGSWPSSVALVVVVVASCPWPNYFFFASLSTTRSSA